MGGATARSLGGQPLFFDRADHMNAMSTNRAVYVIDDESAIRRSTTYFLATVGMEARPYDGGQSFLEELPDLKPGCVLLDVRMPDIDGFQVLEAMSKWLDRFPVVVMTGHGDVATAVRAMKLGARDFLEKPFEEEAMLGMLEHALADLEVHMPIAKERRAAEMLAQQLTQREKDVLCGLIEGYSNKSLAFRLGLSVRTVEMHRANMMDRLNAKSFSEAIRIAYLADLCPFLLRQDKSLC